MDGFQIITTVPLLVLLAIATLIDWREHRVPNALTLGGAVFGLILQSSIAGPLGLVLGLGGWAVCLVCFIPFYLSGGMAAGDIKLMAAVGAFLGPLDGVAACLCTVIVGALIALASLTYGTLSRSENDAASGPAMTLRAGLRAKIPYAGAIAAGTTLALLRPLFLDRLLGFTHSGVFV